ncbi:hypothetical protein ATCC90586_002521 [Pythium insidiosum]|nr:hypothetical protein ATCC90586_002521 [Pythium insidiosum]
MNVWVSASDGDIDAVKQFLANGGDVNIKDEFGYTPLQAAVSYNHLELVLFLLSNGASVTLVSQPFDEAIEEEHTELIALYESLGAEKSELPADEDEPQQWDIAME